MNEDNKTVAAMDCLVPGIGEIIGGSQREDDYDKLVARMDELGLRKEAYGFYLDLDVYKGQTQHCSFSYRHVFCDNGLIHNGPCADYASFHNN